MFVSLTEVALSTHPHPRQPPSPSTKPSLGPVLLLFAQKQAGGGDWLDAQEEEKGCSRAESGGGGGESASVRAWSTNQPKKKTEEEEVEEVGVGVGGGTQWLGLCFGNVNEAGNFLSVWKRRSGEGVCVCVWAMCALGVPAEQRSGARFQD